MRLKRVNSAFLIQLAAIVLLIVGLAFGVDSLLICGLVASMIVQAYLALVVFRLGEGEPDE
ncbi:MAG: hypothetical protein PUK40_05415 [Actinomycetaceae bacterium]|nr:hypothetical protein [Arcanobacterium sp.]MDD7505368.1 hypothetical protein [Actinomycetaceae bacterium]MDY6142747.1 hypothetical protein [Arcanobacterium sp.]